MTRHAETTWTARCDGTLATACDVAHPGTPHTCPASLTATDPLALQHTLDDARWVTTTDARERHYCPAHRDQAPDSDPAARTWADATGLPLDH